MHTCPKPLIGNHVFISHYTNININKRTLWVFIYLHASANFCPIKLYFKFKIIQKDIQYKMNL